jgi:adenine/guanine/hypoxanthine permease
VDSRKSEAPLDLAAPNLSAADSGWLERLFKLRVHGTTVKTELIAGLTTFITMAYIIFVNPNIMADAGIDHGAAFVATCIAAALGCLLMGLYANWPVGLAPGMGLNAFFTYTVVGTMGYTWETALGAVFISGVLFIVLTLSRIREWLLNSIPVSLRHAMGAGVGLFLGVIGLKTAGIIVDSPATLIKLGSLHEPAPLLAAICFLLIAILSYHRVFGAILISIIAVTLAGWGLGLVHYNGILATPPSLAPTWLAMDVMGVFNVSMISVVFAFLFVHMFDTAGTLMGVAQRAGLVNPDGKIHNLSRALKADSASSVFGAMVGVPPVTSYVESAAGVAAGGRTGLTAVTVGVLFVAAMFFAPLAGMIPAYATAGALIYVAMLMMASMAHINWDDATDSIPAIVTAIMMPLTFSVADGIALGFITYVALKAGSGKYREISVSLWVLCAIFIAKFIFL